MQIVRSEFAQLLMRFVNLAFCVLIQTSDRAVNILLFPPISKSTGRMEREALERGEDINANVSVFKSSDYQALIIE